MALHGRVNDTWRFLRDGGLQTKKKLWLGLSGGNRDKIRSDEDYQKMRGQDSWYTTKGQIFFGDS